MFWRIHKFTPDVVAKRCGVYAFLIVSVLFNVGLLSRLSVTQAAAAPRVDYAAFVKQVTEHLFDANYTTVRDSMEALPNEIFPYALNRLKQDQIVPKDIDALEATVRELTDAQSVSSVKFERIDIGRLTNMIGPDGKTKVAMLPADLKFEVVVHDNERVQTTPLHLKYYLANATNPKTGESRPIVFNYEAMQDASTTDSGSN